MKKLSLFIFISITSTSWLYAQLQTEEDKLNMLFNMYDAERNISHSLNQISKMSKSNCDDLCKQNITAWTTGDHAYKEANGSTKNSADKNEKAETEIVCIAPESNEINLNPKDYTIFMVKSPDHLPDHPPDHLPGRSMDAGTPNGVNVMFAFHNDNLMMGLYGVISGYDKDGDDFGETHGTRLAISKNFYNTYRITLTGATTLYSKYVKHDNKEVGKNKVYQQEFNNENMIHFMLDNLNQNKLFYYKVGAGWIQLDKEKHGSILRASGQQKNWHKLIKTYQFNNVSTDMAKSSLSVDAFFGIQKNLINKKASCRLRVYGEAGGNYSKLNNEYFSGEAGAVFYFQKKKSPLTLKTSGSFQSMVHTQGVQNNLTIGLGAQLHRTSLEFEYSKKSNTLQNHVGYNLPNTDNGRIDPIMNIKFKYIFGSWNPKKKK